ncbi:MAG: hypothetical protein NZ956_01990 [Candidatus Caldarchaeum sp.]|nr:hypothetical protein [Candidatus Caldarchaeum sp.]
MRIRTVLGALVGVGVLLQIFLGESGLAAGAFRDIHAAIGLLGIVVTAGYLFMNNRNRAMAAIAAVVLLITVVQAVMGLSLYGWLRLEIPYRALIESHRGTAYILFALGIAASVVAVIIRRRSKATS